MCYEPDYLQSLRRVVIAGRERRLPRIPEIFEVLSYRPGIETRCNERVKAASRPIPMRSPGDSRPSVPLTAPGTKNL